MNPRSRRSLGLALTLALACVGGNAVIAGEAATPGVIEAALASTQRPDADRAQDEPRKAAEFLEFLGVGPGQTVLDAFAAGGYYTELLARIVGDSGRVIAYNNPPYANFAAKGIAARYADGRLPNVEQLTVAVDQLELAPASLDAAIFVMSYHDLYWRPTDGSWPPTDPRQLLGALYGALKPGGVIVVQDHVAAPGGDPSEVVDKLHRIDPATVRRDFEATGFEFAGESSMLAHPDDDHTLQVFDPSVRGHTDQFVFRFRKPRQ